ncbi:DUF6279 family lipoprotein [Aestuariirhabdus litorea]|uniref:Lipoprotein n=1 Tax=Aestuariirhabdus litorea TaxID=2528527 RepID=A0A3P3VPT3_9GAMM|nr:DUF6279 family lipoprotein [Aestuariirhabdus litorea]RRJ83676.1 hypothetical protein D0544_00705 [Aestuariirhabdus litorea]RWW96898.1 hypothetical protein DZC74_00705 [Endozoicomonadaceae bacterium GTF-13]
MVRTVARLGWLVSVLVLLAACTLKPVYNNLYWLVPWYVEDYVTLREGQGDQLRDRVKALIQVHREEQVPHYIDFLRSLEPYAEGVEEARLWEGYQRLEALWLALKWLLLPDIEAFLLSLDSAQQQELFEKLAEANEEQRQQLIEQKRDRSQRYRERAESLMEDWLGSINDGQWVLLESYLKEVGSGDEGWLENRERWQQALAEALRSPQPRARVRELVIHNRRLWSPDYRAAVERRRQLTVELISRISYTLDARQKAHFKKSLQEMINNFQSL